MIASLGLCSCTVPLPNAEPQHGPGHIPVRYLTTSCTESLQYLWHAESSAPSDITRVHIALHAADNDRPRRATRQHGYPPIIFTSTRGKQGATSIWRRMRRRPVILRTESHSRPSDGHADGQAEGRVASKGMWGSGNSTVVVALVVWLLDQGKDDG